LFFLPTRRPAFATTDTVPDWVPGVAARRGLDRVEDLATDIPAAVMRAAASLGFASATVWTYACWLSMERQRVSAFALRASTAPRTRFSTACCAVSTSWICAWKIGSWGLGLGNRPAFAASPSWMARPVASRSGICFLPSPIAARSL
jgi:hypothetical protein